MLTGRGPTARGPGVGPRLHGFCPFGAGLAALLSGGSRPSSGRGIVVASLEGTKVRPRPGRCGSEGARPPVQARLASRPYLPPRRLATPAVLALPVDAPPRPRIAARLSMTVHSVFTRSSGVAAGSSSHLHLEKCIRTGPGSPGPARRGKQRRPHRSPPRTFPAASGSAQGCTAPPQPRRAQPASPEAGCPSRAVQCGRR